MKETVVETYLTKCVEKAGGICEKHVSPGRQGVPDRLVTWSPGIMHLIETKKPKGKPKDNQKRDHKKRRKLGVIVFVIDTKEKVDIYIDYHGRPARVIEDALRFL